MECGTNLDIDDPPVMITRDGTEFLCYKCMNEDKVIFSIPLKNQDDNYILTYTISRDINGRAIGTHVNHHRDVMILGGKFKCSLKEFW